MTVTADAPAAAPASESTAAPLAPAGLAGILGSGDHKTLGRLWVMASMVHLVLVALATVLVSAERIDSATFDVLGADWALQVETFRFIGAVFLLVLPLTVGVATTVVPLQVGASTLAFPRAAAAAAWGYLLGGGLLIGSYVIDGGAGGDDIDGVELFLASFVLVVVSLAVAWICLATTVLALRAPRLGLARLPLFSWSVLVAAAVWLLTLPFLVALAVLGFLDVRYGGFLNGDEGGAYDRIAWAFDTPTVYALAIPVLGFIGSVVPVFAQTRHHLHRVALGLIGAFGALTVGAWTAPHLDGDRPAIYDGPWVAVTIVALLPVLALAGLWALTVARGRVKLGSPLVLAVVALLLLLLGLVAGAVQAIEPIETLVDGDGANLHGTAWSTGVTALVLLATVAAMVGAVVYWSPKLLGTTFSEGGARLAATLVLLGAAIGCVAELVAGLLGQPGTVTLAAADNTDTLETLALVTTVGDGVLVLGGLLFVVLFVQAAVRDETAADDPWEGHTLEWATSSPPAAGNFASLPEITSEAALYDARHRQQEADV
jgi:heme/copper-type cytochrome/quinol oxidase subunit 1